MSFQFRAATEVKTDLRLGLIGPSGSGKTYSALAIAVELASETGATVGVIDTEHGSAAKYAALFEFQHLDLQTYSPETYIAALHAAASHGIGIVIIDSLSHAWIGQDGALEQLDVAAARKGGNRFAAWADVTPMHRRMIDAILAYPGHVIATMRSKTEWVLDSDGNGKTAPRRVGTAPVQREGMEYEFDVVGDLTLDHELVITKTRYPALDGKTFRNPGADVAALLLEWVSRGDERPRKREVVPALLAEEFAAALAEAGLSKEDASLLFDGRRPSVRQIAERLEAHDYLVAPLVDEVRAAVAESMAGAPAEPAEPESD